MIFYIYCVVYNNNNIIIIFIFQIMINHVWIEYFEMARFSLKQFFIPLCTIME